MTAAVSVVLGSTYSPDLWDLRKRISADRAAGARISFVKVRAPINSDVIEVAILSGSLYLIGVRHEGGGWLEFANDEGLASSAMLSSAKPRLPGSRWITVGNGIALSSYRALRIKDVVARAKPGARTGFVGTPGQLIGALGRWDGRLDATPERLQMCVLIFLLCEALRFRSIEQLCANWINGRGPAADSQMLAITSELIDKVQNWKSAAARTGADKDEDIWTWLPGAPDELIA